MNNDGVVDATRIVEQLVLEKHAVQARVDNLTQALMALAAEHDPEEKGRFRLTKAQVASGARITSVSVEPDKGGMILTIERAEPEAV